MTGAAWALLVVAGLAAVVNWFAVVRRPALARVENIAKPAVLVALIGVALTLDPVDGAQRAWFVVALVGCLAGDVFLLPSVDRFVPGLASFLLGHVAFIVGFAVRPAADERFIDLGALIVVGWVAIRVVRGVRRTELALLPPVLVYMAVITTMLAVSMWHGDVARVGAGTFVASDSILALDRFDRHRHWMPVAVIVTYHVAVALLVLSLA